MGFLATCYERNRCVPVFQCVSCVEGSGVFAVRVQASPCTSVPIPRIGYHGFWVFSVSVAIGCLCNVNEGVAHNQAFLLMHMITHVSIGVRLKRCSVESRGFKGKPIVRFTMLC